MVGLTPGLIIAYTGKATKIKKVKISQEPWTSLVPVVF